MQYNLKLITKTSAIIVASIAVLNLIGWGSDNIILIRVVTSFDSMKVNTAICFLLSGISLWAIVTNNNNTHPKKTISLICALLILGISLITLSEYIFEIDLFIDELFIKDIDNKASFPGRTSPVTAFTFCLVGIDLLFQTFKTVNCKSIQLLAFAVFFFSLLAFTGYFYGAEVIFSKYFDTTMAVNTAFAFMTLSFGLLTAPGKNGYMIVFVSETIGGKIARRGIPLVIIIPLFLGWLRLAGEKYGFYDTKFGLVFFCNACIFIFIVLIFWNSIRLMNLENEEKKGRFSSEVLLNTVSQAVIATNLEGEITYWNHAAEKMYGWKIKEALGQNILKLTNPEISEKKRKDIVQQLSKGINWDEEILIKHKNGSFFPAKIYDSPILDDTKKMVGVIGITIDISERKRAERELLKANRKLASQNKEIKKQSDTLTLINQELKQFVYIASHDLQEPLRTISNYVGIIETKFHKKIDDATDLYLNYIIAATTKMQSLIKDLLDYSRVGRKIELVDVDCNSIIKETIVYLNTTITESNAKIFSEPLPVIRGNYLEIKQLFQNLLSNAIKFRKKEVVPEIKISCEEKKNEYVFAIKDNGIGIEKRFLTKLFVVFQRLNNSADYPGTGIGLAICKKIARLHHGNIWIESDFGVGSTVYFNIPKE